MSSHIYIEFDRKLFKPSFLNIPMNPIPLSVPILFSHHASDDATFISPSGLYHHHSRAPYWLPLTDYSFANGGNQPTWDAIWAQTTSTSKPLFYSFLVLIRQIIASLCCLGCILLITTSADTRQPMPNLWPSSSSKQDVRFGLCLVNTHLNPFLHHITHN